MSFILLMAILKKKSIGGLFYKSSDGGTTWDAPVQLPLLVIPPGRTILKNSRTYKVLVDVSQSSDIVLIATDIGIMRSDDGGKTFKSQSLFPKILPQVQSVTSMVKTSIGYIAYDQFNQVFMKSGDSIATNWIVNDILIDGNQLSQIPTVKSILGRVSMAVAIPGENIVYACM